MSYQNIKINFIEFSAFGRISIEVNGTTYTVNVLKSEQYLKGKLSDVIGYITFTFKKK